MITVATCQYAIEVLAGWSAYVDKMEAVVKQAAQTGAQLLLLPEYAGIEIGCGHYATDAQLYAAMQSCLGPYKDLHQRLAKQYQLIIQAGTVMEAISPGCYVNRAYLFGSAGVLGYQDKLQLIESEKQSGLLQAGQQQTLFDTAIGKIGIAVCYDSEFPEIVTPLLQAGAWLVLVPSYTTSLAGFHRVMLSCRARAIENQCYVMTACAVGTVALSEPSEQAVGHACVAGPADIGFADDGLMLAGDMNTVQMLTLTLDRSQLQWVRQHGQVRNFADRQQVKRNRD